MQLKDIIQYLIIGLLLASSVYAAPSPYPLFAKITLDGSPVHGMQIHIENLRTDEVLTIFTVNGEFVKDLSDFEIYTRPDDDYEIRYCVDDSRCNQETLMFMMTGYRKDLSRDIALKSNGLSGPFPVYGRLTLDGDLIPNVEIKLENLNKEYSKGLETNDKGEYSYNIANWGLYDIGDVIRLTYNQYKTSFTIKSFTDPGYELNLNIKTSDDKDDKPDVVPEPVEPEEEEEIPEEEPEEEEEIVEPQPSPETNKGGLLIIILVILIIIGVGYILYKKHYKS